MQCSVVAFVGDASLGFVLKEDYSSNSSPHQFCVFLVQIFGRSSAWPKILSQSNGLSTTLINSLIYVWHGPRGSPVHKLFHVLPNLYGVYQYVPPFAGNRNETIRYYYSPSGQLNLSIFNLDSLTLYVKIVHQTPEIQACKVKFYCARETRGFEKRPSHDLYHGYFPKHLSTLTFSFSI